MKTFFGSVMAIAVVTMLAAGVPLHAAKVDDGIESSAKKSHIFKTQLKDDDIKIDSEDGVVTLTGTVSEESHKEMAEETVASLPNVKKVNNKLEVEGERHAEGSDAWVLTKVKTALMFHRNVSGIGTDVDVKDGVVTLRGEAESREAKDLATEYARDIEGVKDVRNEMTVSGDGHKKDRAKGGGIEQAIDDASVTAMVKMSLAAHRSTSALGTDVDTKNGVVTVTGTAKNEAEKDLVTKVVEDVDGVQGVKNKMTVGKKSG